MEDNKPSLDTIKRRIRGLKSKAMGGATEAELASALALAKKLMAEWRIEEADLGDQQAKPGIIEVRLAMYSNPERWEMSLGIVCEELFQVRSFIRTMWEKSERARAGWVKKTSLCFCGYPGDVEMAEEMHSYLKAQVILISRRYAGSGASAERSSYGCGVVHRVINGVREAKLAGEAAVAATCRALVVRRLAEVDAHMAIAIPMGKAKKSRQVADRHYRQGWEDGKHVDLGMNKKCLPQGAA